MQDPKKLPAPSDTTTKVALIVTVLMFVIIGFGIYKLVTGLSKSFSETSARLDKEKAERDSQKAANPQPTAAETAKKNNSDLKMTARLTVTGVEFTSTESSALNCKAEINYGLRDGYETRFTIEPNVPKFIEYGEFSKNTQRFNINTNKIERLMVNMCEGQSLRSIEFTPTS